MVARLNIQRTGGGAAEHMPLKPGNNRLKVVPGRQFILQDPDGHGIDPAQLRVIQVENDLVIENIPVADGAEPATITLEGYYQVCSASDRCTVSVASHAGAGDEEQTDNGQAGLGSTDNSPTEVLADVDSKPLGALADGTFVLYDQNFQAPAQPTAEEFPIRPVLYGAGGLAVVALAAAGGGGGGDPSGAPDLGNVPLALKSATSFNNRFPTISGTAKPGTIVTLRLDTDNDQRENVTYSATADANGNWNVNLQTAKPASGTLPANGLSDSNTLEISGALDGVQGAALPIVTLTYDNTPPARAEIGAIADDNIITAAEKTAGVTVSGTAEANGSVEVKIGSTTKVAAVGADGKWSAALSAAELPAADGQYQLTATAIDAAGNRGPAATSPVTVHTSSTTPVIGSIAGNDIINAAEAAAGVKLQGSAEAGSKVELTFGTSKLAATADANGHWEVTAPATTLADGAQTLTAAVTSPTGGTASASRAFTVDKTAPPKASGIKFDGGDTTITATEARDGVHITGTAEAGATVSVTWNGHTHTGTVSNAGAWDVQFVPADLPHATAGSTVNSAVQVTVQDTAGNTSGAESVDVTVQGAPTPTIAPSTTVSTPAASTPAAAASPTQTAPGSSSASSPDADAGNTTTTGNTTTGNTTTGGTAGGSAMSDTSAGGATAAGDTTTTTGGATGSAAAGGAAAGTNTATDADASASAGTTGTTGNATGGATGSTVTGGATNGAAAGATTDTDTSAAAGTENAAGATANSTTTPAAATSQNTTNAPAASDSLSDTSVTLVPTTNTTTVNNTTTTLSSPANTTTTGSSGSSATPAASGAKTPAASKSLVDTLHDSGTDNTHKSLTLDDLTHSHAQTHTAATPAPTPVPTAPPPAPASTTATVDSLVSAQPWEHPHPTV